MQCTNYKKLTVENLRERYDSGIRDFANVDLRGQNLKGQNLQEANFSGAKLQRANFSEAKLQGCDFCDARLQEANFSKAELVEAKFNNAETGMSFLGSLISLIATVFVSLLGLLIAFCIGVSFALYLFYQLPDSQSKAQFMSIIAYIVILITGTCYFWVIPLLKYMDEAMWGVFVAAIAILLVMLDQPLTSALAWLIVLVGLIRLTQVLFNWNRYFAIVIPITSIIMMITILYNYEFIQSSDSALLISLISGLLIINIISSFIVAITFVGFNIVTYRKKAAILPTLLLLIGLSIATQLIIIKFIQDTTITLVIIIILAVAGITAIIGITGIYIGHQALRDKPNYRLIRDCGVGFCLGFGTNFREANLTSADFSDAALHHANFAKATLKHTRWKGAKGIQSARFSSTYLRHTKIRRLLQS